MLLLWNIHRAYAAKRFLLINLHIDSAETACDIFYWWNGQTKIKIVVHLKKYAYPYVFGCG